MGRNFVFGDLHGGVDGEMQFLSNRYFSEQKNLTKEDVVFNLGDFGLLWYYPQCNNLYKKDINLSASLADKNFTIFVIPGNHENYDLINVLPQITKWGGTVYVLKTKKGDIFFAKRGEIYKVNGKTIFTFSGALSGDIEYRVSLAEVGTFKKTKVRVGDSSSKRVIKKMTIGKVSYWPQELSTQEERDYLIVARNIV